MKALHEDDGGIFVHPIQIGPWDNFVYFIGDRRSRTCAVVDPAWDLDAILKAEAELDVEITHVLCTHSHFDHVNRVDPLLEKRDVPVHMLKHEVEFSGFAPNNLVSNDPGDVLELGEHLQIQMIHTPGHTPGSCTYRIPGAIVTGDTLFVQGCGRCDFVGGDPAVMYGTLRSLTSALPADTIVYPGHDYGPTSRSTLGSELVDNVFLKRPTLDDFVAHRMDGKTPNTELPPDP